MVNSRRKRTRARTRMHVCTCARVPMQAHARLHACTRTRMQAHAHSHPRARDAYTCIRIRSCTCAHLRVLALPPPGSAGDDLVLASPASRPPFPPSSRSGARSAPAADASRGPRSDAPTARPPIGGCFVWHAARPPIGRCFLWHAARPPVFLAPPSLCPSLPVLTLRPPPHPLFFLCYVFLFIFFCLAVLPWQTSSLSGGFPWADRRGALQTLLLPPSPIVSPPCILFSMPTLFTFLHVFAARALAFSLCFSLSLSLSRTRTPPLTPLFPPLPSFAHMCTVLLRIFPSSFGVGVLSLSLFLSPPLPLLPPRVPSLVSPFADVLYCVTFPQSLFRVSPWDRSSGPAFPRDFPGRSLTAESLSRRAPSRPFAGSALLVNPPLLQRSRLELTGRQAPRVSIPGDLCGLNIALSASAVHPVRNSLAPFKTPSTHPCVWTHPPALAFRPLLGRAPRPCFFPSPFSPPLPFYQSCLLPTVATPLAGATVARTHRRPTSRKPAVAVRTSSNPLKWTKLPRQKKQKSERRWHDRRMPIERSDCDGENINERI